jgi:hypothetical protein
MPIVTVCQGCGQRLSVADEYAGRTARCPQCKCEYTVPEAKPDAGFGTAASDKWQLRTEDGKVYGPTSKANLDQWVAEGRVTVACQVKRETDSLWQSASQLYPQLTATGAGNPFADRQPGTNPYSAPAGFTPAAARRFSQPHRGGVILTLGIIGIVCCQLLAPVAWVMGQTDLRQIDSGVMDPEGRTMTQVGMVLGIIGTALLILSVVFQVIAVAVNL